MLKIESLKGNFRYLLTSKPLFQLVFLVVIEFFLSILVDPYIEILSPFQNSVINSILPLFLILILYYFTMRLVLSIFLTNLLHILLVLVNFKKTEILNSNLIYYDFLLVNQYIEGLHLILGFISSYFPFILIGFILLLGIIYLIIQKEKPYTLKPKFRAIILVFIIIFTYYTNKIVGKYIPVEIPFLNWSTFNQIQGATAVGVTGNLQMGYLLSGHELKKIDPNKIKLFWNEPFHLYEALPSIDLELKPDVIILQSESLIDPGDLQQLNKKYSLNFIRSNISKDKQGYVVPPVWGGYTLQTEFEVLTGISTNFFGSRAAYYDLPLDTVPSIPKIFHSNQYKTIALHPNDGKYWNRNIAFQKLGFAEFKDLQHYWQWKDDRKFKNSHNLISDYTFIKSILQELDQVSSPTLLFAISLGNHGPWGMFDDSEEINLPLEDSQKKILSDYLHTTKEVDDSFKILFNYLKQRKRPTLLIFYSDHLPGFGDLYSSIPFKNNRSPVSQGVPLFVWSNYPLPYSLPEYLPSYLLGGWILKASGIQAENQFIGAQKLCDTMQMQRESYETILQKYESIWDNYKHMSGYFLTHSK